MRVSRTTYGTWKRRDPSRLLKNTLRSCKSSLTKNCGCAMGGFWEHHEASRSRVGHRQRGQELSPPPVLPLSSCRCRQLTHAHQDTPCGGEGEHPTNPCHAAMTHLAQQPNGLHPAKDLFHTCPFPLTHGVARMARGAPINSDGPFAHLSTGLRKSPQCVRDDRR